MTSAVRDVMNPMAVPLAVPSDRELIAAARAGDRASWTELVARHQPAVVAVARVTGSSGSRARTREAMDAVRRSIFEDDADQAWPQYARLRDVRCRILAALTGGSVGPGAAPDRAIDELRRTERPDRQDLIALATAFLTAPSAWQTAIWHGHAEGRTATEIGVLLGRSANEVASLHRAAESGVYESYLLADAARIPDLDSTSAALLPLLGGHRRGVLAPVDQRRVDEIIANRIEGSPVALHAARWLAVGDDIGSLLPSALVPGLVGLPPQQYRAVLGTGLAIGSAGLAARRSQRIRRLARIGAAGAILAAILGTAFLFWNPLQRPGDSAGVTTITTATT